VKLWQRLVRDCRLSEEAIGGGTPVAAASAAAASPPLDGEELFQHNVQQINVMRVAAGSMVKGLIMELERSGRNTYIRLRNPVPNGHIVDYDFVRGDRTLVSRVGRALGFASVTDSRLEVRSA
jgi:hypothetical protein